MKKIGVSLILFCICAFISIHSFAVENVSQDSIYLNISISEIKNEEEFSFTINVANARIAAFDITILFNSELLEYISGPANTNVIGNKILTVWYDETGGKNVRQNSELVKYTFKAKKIENEFISIQGEFYNEEGVLIQNFIDGIEIIANEEKQTESIEISEESQVAKDNSNLEILRLNHEGMTPLFSPEITEYYFLTETLNELSVTAIPQNANAEVIITGNTNLKEGVNPIRIKVISADKTNETEYTIFVTKTKDVEKANAKLETLAIENVILEPNFVNEIYQYHATISNTIQNLNILAIPEKQSANVEIIGGENLKVGDNEIRISVTAENGYTKRQYVINVYKRNEEEQKIEEQNQKINLEKLNAVLEEQKKEDYTKGEEQTDEEKRKMETRKDNKWITIVFGILAIIIFLLVIYRIKKEKMDKNKVRK